MVKAFIVILSMLSIASCAGDKYNNPRWSISGTAIYFCHDYDKSKVCSKLPSNDLGIEIINKKDYI